MPQPTSQPLATEYRTVLGRAVCGDSLEIMEAEVDDESLDLIVTSPPYALLQKKQYGNEDEENYVEWFLPFAQVFKRKLKPTGSLILNLGGAWMPGSPQRSLYIYRLLLRLCDKDVGYHFCQELYWYNPAKLPAPVQWVNKKRSRVKDAVEQIFWLSPTPEPKADNRDVLVEYSKSMERLIKTGKYNWGQRPSGHLVGKNWARDNGGAISSNLITDTDTRGLLDAILDEVRMPSNLLVESNTSSQGEFFERCRAEGIPVHPARFPPIIPEYFIRFLTDPGDLVCDPFAGSNTTGAVAEDLERRWISIELMPEYFEASAFRFPTVEWTRRDEP